MLLMQQMIKMRAKITATIISIIFSQSLNLYSNSFKRAANTERGRTKVCQYERIQFLCPWRQQIF